MSLPPPNCADVVRELWDFLDGEGDAVQWTGIQSHLGSCVGCKSHVDFCRDFLARVGTSPVDAEKVEAMRIRVLAALSAEPRGP